MNLIALYQNFIVSLRVCPTWGDGWQRLKWLYDRDEQSKKYVIDFRFAPPVGDVRLQVRGNKGSDAFIISEVFEHRYYDLPLDFTPSTVLDLGANVGLTAIYFARTYPTAQIAAVEPMPNNLELLEANFDANNINAQVFAAAISTSDGTLEMEISDKDYGHKVSGLAEPKSENLERRKNQNLIVRAISVPTIMRELGWQKIGLMKIDIEGYEQVLLTRNCDWLKQVDAICIEPHDDYGERDLSELATKYDFKQPVQLPGTWLLTRA